MSDKKVFILSNPMARRNAARACAEAPDGYRVEIRERTRTLSQNDLLWSCLTDLSKQVPWTVNGKKETLTPEEWKALATSALDQEQRMASGLKGGFVMLGKSTSKMGVKKMGELITFLHVIGTEQGVKWSPTSLGRDA